MRRRMLLVGLSGVASTSAFGTLPRIAAELPNLLSTAMAPDEVRYRKPIHEITASLLQHPTAHTLPGLRAFASRTGAPL